MTNPHFTTADSWDAAGVLLGFEPAIPRRTAGFALRSLAIHVRDYEMRELPLDERTLEARYDVFVFSQSRPGAAEARRLALETSYGPAPHASLIARREARWYDLGPEVEPDDIDGRMPAVVTWHDGETFYLVASGELEADALLDIAASIYSGGAKRR